jgi:transglutaminase-like putative cysteine protease
MIRLDLSLVLAYTVADPGCDFIFNIHAAPTPQQRVFDEHLSISQDVPWRIETDAASANRYLRLQGRPGELRVGYRATIELEHVRAQPADIGQVPIDRLPTSVLGYVYPSRYCQSDRLQRLARREFGHLAPGYARVQAICDWVSQHVEFVSNSSDSNTSAIDTLLERAGVCRDFAHLMIALCRALNVPARFTTGIDYGADPALGPTDFHAYVEAYLGGHWYLFDPSGTAIPMGFVRLGTGRDAADVAFATIFGPVTSNAPLIGIRAVADAQGRLELPERTTMALSTDAGPAG